MTIFAHLAHNVAFIDSIMTATFHQMTILFYISPLSCSVITYHHDDIWWSYYYRSPLGDPITTYQHIMIHYHKLPCGYPVTTYHHVVILLPHITTWWPYNHKPLCCDLLPHITSWWPLTHKRDIVFHHQVDLPPTLLQEHRCLRQGEVGHIIVIDGQDPVPDLYGAFSVIARVTDVHFA